MIQIASYIFATAGGHITVCYSAPTHDNKVTFRGQVKSYRSLPRDHTLIFLVLGVLTPNVDYELIIYFIYLIVNL